MTVKQALKELKKLQKSDDPEERHAQADQILCELLIELGYWRVVNEYDKILKYYAWKWFTKKEKQ